MTTPRVLVVGPSRAGKDVACALLAEVTTLRFAGTTSAFLLRHVAAHLGVTADEAMRTRHRDRGLWTKVGNVLRREDPAVLVREALADADITGGVRTREEVQAARAEGLADCVVWIESARAVTGHTVRFGPEECDEIVANNGTIDDFREALRALAVRRGWPLREMKSP